VFGRILYDIYQYNPVRHPYYLNDFDVSVSDILFIKQQQD